MSGPLGGLRVLEMAGIGPCPLAGQLLGDLGADVVVVDRKSGEVDLTDINRRNKRSIALDLKSSDGVEVVLRLIEKADILIEGFRPGVMERLGLGPEVCQLRNPGLVYGRMTGWGQSGPLSQSAGHDINYLALTGVLSAIGRKGEPPVPPLNLVADYAGGTMFLLFGLLAAIFERQTSGKGQVVDAAMIDGVPLLAGLMHTMLARGTWSSERQDNLLDGGVPYYCCYETADGKFISIGPLEPAFFAELVERVGLPDEFRERQYDRDSRAEMHEACEVLFKSRTRDEWDGILSGTDVCYAPVLGWGEASLHPHNVDREVFFENGGVMQASPAPRFDRTVVGKPKPPRAVGGDALDILKECAFTEDEVERLRDVGVLT